MNLLFSPVFTDRSKTIQKTYDPSWDETFIHETKNAKNIGFAVFHDAALTQDDFVANCAITFEEVMQRPEKQGESFWVSFVFRLFSVKWWHTAVNHVNSRGRYMWKSVASFSARNSTTFTRNLCHIIRTNQHGYAEIAICAVLAYCKRRIVFIYVNLNCTRTELTFVHSIGVVILTSS